MNNMNTKELKEMAKELKVKNWWTLKKAELIAAIEAAQKEDYTIVAENSNGEITIIAECHHEDIAHEAQNYTESAEEVTYEEVIVEEDEAIQDEPETAKRNGWEKIATDNITNAYNWIVGENENTLLDYKEGSEEYTSSYNFLHSGDEIIDYIYGEAITTKYGKGYYGGNAPSEMRFAGKKFCMNLIKELLKKDGYLKDEEKKPRGKMIEFNGKSQTLNKWAEELGFTPQTLFARLYISHWTVKKAFTTPSRRKAKSEDEEA